jgi:hypothetical protein
MRDLVKPSPDVRAIFGEVIERLLNGDMAGKKNANGWTYIEQLAKDLFERPELAAKLTAMAHLPAVKASIERAAALNAPKLALLATAERCKKLDGFDRGRKSPQFYSDLPYTIEHLDERHGPHVYLPVHRNYNPLGTDYDGGPARSHDVADLAWHFRRDPREIEGAWSPKQRDCCYFYTSVDYDNCLTENAFLATYRDRLRRVLAEALPGVGGLSLEHEW